MPCGHPGDEYADALKRINFGQLYQEGMGQSVFTHLKEVIIQSREYDYVLVDSRTGFSDACGICTRDLADRLVVFTGLNHQNVEGTLRFFNRAKASGLKNLEEACLVLSPVPIGYEEIRRSNEALLVRSIHGLVGEIRAVLQVPYHPRLGIDEAPFTFDWSDTPVFKAYSQIAAVIRGYAGDTPQRTSDDVVDLLERQDFGGAFERLLDLVEQSEAVAVTVLRSVAARLVHTVPRLRAHCEPFFRELIRLVPHDPVPHIQLADIFRLLRAREKAVGELTVVDSMTRTSRNTSAEGGVAVVRASLMADQNRFDDAEHFYTKALSLYEEADDRRGQVDVLCSKGQMYRILGRHKEAILAFDSAYQLSVEQRPKDRLGAARALLGKGVVCLAIGQIAEAHHNFNEAKYHDPNDESVHAVAIGLELWQGRASLLEGDKIEALDHIRRALQLATVQSGAAEAEVLLVEAQYHHSYTPAFTEAEADFTAALRIAERVGRSDLEANAKGGLAECALHLGMHDLAAERFHDALNVVKRWNIPGQRGSFYRGLAAVEQLKGNLKTATEWTEQAISAHRVAGEILEGYAAELHLAVIQRSSGAYEQALVTCQRALDGFTELGVRRGIANGERVLGSILFVTGSINAATKRIVAAIAAYDRLDDELGKALARHTLGKVVAGVGKFEEAAEFLRNSLSLSQEFGRVPSVVATKRQLGILERARENFSVARKLFVECKEVYERLQLPYRARICAQEVAYTDVLAKQSVESSLAFLRKSLQDKDMAPVAMARSRRILADALIHNGHIHESQEVLGSNLSFADLLPAVEAAHLRVIHSIAFKGTDEGRRSLELARAFCEREQIVGPLRQEIKNRFADNDS